MHLANNALRLVCAAVTLCTFKVSAEDQILEKIFDSPGSYKWIVPVGVQEIEVSMVGGGGSGGRGGHYEIWSAPEKRVLTVRASHEHHGGTHIDMNWSDPVRIRGPVRVRMSGGSCGNSMWDHLGAHRFHRAPDYNRYHHLPSGTEEWRTGEERIFSISVGGPGFRWDQCDQHLDVEYLDEFNALGLNGYNGESIPSKVITNLQPEDVLEVVVGAGGKDGRGGDTRITIHDKSGNLKPIVPKGGSGVDALVAAGGARGPDGREKVRMISQLEPIKAAPGVGGYGAQQLGIEGGEGQGGRVKLTYVQNIISTEQINQAQWQAYALTREIGQYTRELAMGIKHANEALDRAVTQACVSNPLLKQALDTIEELRNNAQRSVEILNGALQQFEDLLIETIKQDPEFFQPLLDTYKWSGIAIAP